MRNGAQRRQVFDRLVRRPAFTKPDRIVCEDVDYLNLRKRGEPDSRSHVIGEGHERSAIGNQSAV